MADSVIDDALIVLTDQWPGAALQTAAVPTGGFTGSSHHNVATAVYRLGTKVQVYDTTNNGWSTFIYLKLESQHATNVLAAKHICALHSDAAMTDVTNDPAADITAQKGPICVGLSAFTDADYYGWFWCGGVCPVSFVPALEDDYKTTNAVAIGDMTWNDAASADATYGGFAFDVADGPGETRIGLALSDDDV